VNEDKAKRAAELSMNKYCSVSETLRRSGTNLQWSVIIHERSLTESSNSK
jgi:putative redox protein